VVNEFWLMILVFSRCTGFVIAAGKRTVWVPHVLQSMISPLSFLFPCVFLIKLIFQLKKPQTNTLHPNPQILPISLGLTPLFSQAQDLIYAKDFMFDFGQVT